GYEFRGHLIPATPFSLATSHIHPRVSLLPNTTSSSRRCKVFSNIYLPSISSGLNIQVFFFLFCLRGPFLRLKSERRVWRYYLDRRLTQTPTRVCFRIRFNWEKEPRNFSFIAGSRLEGTCSHRFANLKTTYWRIPSHLASLSWHPHPTGAC